jgi:hypothetical protein
VLSLEAAACRGDGGLLRRRNTGGPAGGGAAKIWAHPGPIWVSGLRRGTTIQRGQRRRVNSASTRREVEVEEEWKLQGEGLVSAVRVVAGVPRHSGHDVEVLQRHQCDQLGTTAPFRWAMRGVCVALGMKVLPVFGWCRRRWCPSASFPSLEASPRCVGTSLAGLRVW